MPELKQQFEKAAQTITHLSERPDNDVLLNLYGLYKQALEGDVKGPKPGLFDFSGTAKYNAWERLRGTSSEEAMKKYIAAVKQLAG